MWATPIRVPDLATQQRIVEGLRELEIAASKLDAAAVALRDVSHTLRDEIAEGRYDATPAL